MLVSDFIKRLYDDEVTRGFAERNCRDWLKHFDHVSRVNEKYCPVAWIMAENIHGHAKKNGWLEHVKGGKSAT